MALTTAFTEMFGVRHPIALAPMGGFTGGALTAAVSSGGGLGLLGAGDGDAAWLAREAAIVAESTSEPWGIGFLTWAIDIGAVERALALSPSAVMLSFGDPRPYADRVRQSGTALIIQVTDLAEARQAIDLGADVIVAQGTEAGGHGSVRGWSTLPFVPVVADLAAPTPVLAAGGIADGRGVAAALALGAAGALVGTRFLATPEALIDPSAAKAIMEGSGKTPSVTACSTSPAAPGGPGGTPPGPSATPSSTGGAAGKRNSPRTPVPGRPTGTGWRAATCPGSRCGRARPST